MFQAWGRNMEVRHSTLHHEGIISLVEVAFARVRHRDRNGSKSDRMNPRSM